MTLQYAFMSFSCPQSTLDEMLAMALRYGYNGIEPRIDTSHAHGVEIDISTSARQAIIQKTQQTGITMCCVATSCRLADPRTAQKEIEHTHRCIDLAADIGSTRLRVFGGPIAEGMDRNEAIHVLVGSLVAVAAHAQQRGVIVCVETHDDWCSPAHLAEVMKRTNHQAIAVNWDIMHPVRQGGTTMDQAFELLRPWIQHVHFHDGADTMKKLVLMRIGQGSIDHRRAIQLLQGAGYTGYLSGEWIDWEPYQQHLPRELATMKSYEGL